MSGSGRLLRHRRSRAADLRSVIPGVVPGWCSSAHPASSLALGCWSVRAEASDFPSVMMSVFNNVWPARRGATAATAHHLHIPGVEDIKLLRDLLVFFFFFKGALYAGDVLIH